jgi:putative peptidoglycan lipid II flippase
VPARPPPPSSDQPGVDAPAADDAISQSGSPSEPPPSPRANLVRSSLVYSGLTLVSRFMGFLRDLVVTARLGASLTAAADAYNTALAFPNLFRRIFAEGAFAAAFVPAYARALETDGEETADQLAADALATLAAATVAITVAAQLAMPWLMYVINPGYASDPAKFKLAVVLTQISMPYLPCMAIVALLSGVLNARGRFALSAAAPTVLNAVMLVFIFPQKDSQAAAYAASWGILAAGVLQAGLLWWGANHVGARIRLRPPRLTPEIKALIGLAIPGALAASATQINIFISGVLASQVAGARSWLAVADRLYQLPLGLVGVAIGVALLPRLSRAVHAGDKADSQAATDEAITLSLAFSLPAAAALAAMPFFLIDGLFTRGEFTLTDAQATARALFHYGWGTPAFVLLRVLQPVFYARQDTKSPMRFALISVAVNIGAGLALFHLIGFEGIAAGTAIAAWLNVGQMVFALARRGDYWPSPAAMARIGKIVIASLAVALLMAGASATRGWFQPLLFGSKEAAVLLTVVVGGVAYLALLFGLKAVTVTDIRGALKRSPAPAALP